MPTIFGDTVFEVDRTCLYANIAFRVIMENQKPDYSMICCFLKEFEAGLRHLFTEVLQVCGSGFDKSEGCFALHRTKIKGNTSLSVNRTYEYLEKEVKQMLREAEVKDVEEALYG